jgi:hypothetical protein
MSCTKSGCPIRGKKGGWICSCQPLDKSDEAIREITEEVAKNNKRK